MSDPELSLQLDTRDALPAKGRGGESVSEELVDQLLETDGGVDEPVVTPQRRARTRPRPSSPRLLVYRLLNGLVDGVQGNRLGKAILLIIVAVSIGTIWYSMTQRGELIIHGHTIVSQREALAVQLDDLRLVVAAQDVDAVMVGVTQAENRVFPEYRQLAQWLADQNSYAERLGLNFRYTIGDVTSARVKNMLEVPIAIEVATGGKAAGVGYLGVLEFLKNIIDAPWYVEIVSASLGGESVGVTEMKANLQVWVRGVTGPLNEEISE